MIIPSIALTMLAALATALELAPLSDTEPDWTRGEPDSVDKLSRSCWAYRFCYFPPPKDERVQVPANPVDYFRGRMKREEGMPPKAPVPVLPNDDGGAREFLLTQSKQQQKHVLLIHNRRTGRIDYCERMLVRDPALVAADQEKQREERRKARAAAASVTVDPMDIHS